MIVLNMIISLSCLKLEFILRLLGLCFNLGWRQQQQQDYLLLISLLLIIVMITSFSVFSSRGIVMRTAASLDKDWSRYCETLNEFRCPLCARTATASSFSSNTSWLVRSGYTLGEIRCHFVLKNGQMTFSGWNQHWTGQMPADSRGRFAIFPRDLRGFIRGFRRRKSTKNPRITTGDFKKYPSHTRFFLVCLSVYFSRIFVRVRLCELFLLLAMQSW